MDLPPLDEDSFLREPENSAVIGLYLLEAAAVRIEDAQFDEALWAVRDRLADLWPCQRTSCTRWLDARTCKDPTAGRCDLHFGVQA